MYVRKRLVWKTRRDVPKSRQIVGKRDFPSNFYRFVCMK